jgi:polyhydroxyalkanoate synthase
MSTANSAQNEVAAPLDLLLVNSTKSFAGRMLPDGSWIRFGGAQAKQPVQVAERGSGLVSELARIVTGKSEAYPRAAIGGSRTPRGWGIRSSSG